MTLPDNSKKPKKDKLVSKDAIFLKLLEVIPKILWVVFFAAIVGIFFTQIEDMLTRISGFEGYGVKIEFETFEKQNKINANNSIASNEYISKAQQELILRRVGLLKDLLSKTQILWVDDAHFNHKYIVQLLEDWKVKVDCPSTTSEAYKRLEVARNEEAKYDIIISDFCRPNDGDGIEFSKQVRCIGGYSDTPIIIYSRYGEHIDKYGIPKEVFAATNRYDNLFHFIFDALERGNVPFPSGMQRYVHEFRNDSTIFDSVCKSKPTKNLKDPCHP
jgi:CheY-like chemotaxis protein